ncbi:ATP-binding protein [Streptomyces sp. NPDC003688]
MTSNPARIEGPTQLSGPTRNLITTPHAFEMRFTSTPRGARLARHLAAVRLHAWDVPYGTDAHDAVVLIVGELTANAVRHGHVPGRDFQLGLRVLPGSRTVRVEVTDTRGERVPRRLDPGLGEAGRGLLLVSRLAVRWDWHPRAEGPGKTVWAEYEIPS